MKLSPSQLETFDPNRSPFACPTKWWFRYVAKKPAPQDISAAWGEARHKEFEHYLRTGENVLHQQTLPALPYLEKLRPHVDGIEVPLEGVSIGGVEFIGRIDVRLKMFNMYWAHDHKTTSNFKYAKDLDGLNKSTQMNIYGLGVIGDFPVVKLSLGYSLSKGRPDYRYLDTLRRREDLEEFKTACAVTVREIKDVAREPEASKVPANLEACNIAQGCPYRGFCPHLRKDKEAFMIDLKQRLMSPPKAPEPAPPPRKLVIEDVPTEQLVRPPDAPGTTNAEAAPTENAPKGPGRPKGVKNKPKEVQVPGVGVVTVEKGEAVSAPKMVIKEMRYKRGMQLPSELTGMPKYTQMSIEVELMAEGTDFEALKERVHSLLEAEVQKVLVKDEPKGE